MKSMMLAALVAAAVIASTRSIGTAQAVVCTAGSSDGFVYSPDQVNYGYEADTTCPVPITYVGVASWIQQMMNLPGNPGWQRNDFPDSLAGHEEALQAKVEDTFYVTPFFGANCRRVLSLHTIIVGLPPSSSMDIHASYSPGTCY
ncbi:MAG: hypothetical protein IVW36_02365 [Dehalococcoidia bacterium]|nr:hypothetical protein [Dehalococcoidia bacterium]